MGSLAEVNAVLNDIAKEIAATPAMIVAAREKLQTQRQRIHGLTSASGSQAFGVPILARLTHIHDELNRLAADAAAAADRTKDWAAHIVS